MNMSEAARQLSDHEKLIADWSAERTVHVEAMRRLQAENARLRRALDDIAKSAYPCPGTPLVCSCAEHKAKRALEFKTADDECASDRDVTGMYD